METTNNTDDETEYRTTSRPPKSKVRQSPWILIGARQKGEIPHPPCPFTIEFRVRGKIVCSKVYDSPVRRITLVKMRNNKYYCRRLLDTPRQEPRPAPRPPRQTPEQKPRQSGPTRPAKPATSSKSPQPSRGRAGQTGARA